MNYLDRSLVQLNYCLTSSVTFGSPSKQCRGNGICSVIPIFFLENRFGFIAKVQLEKLNLLAFEFRTKNLPEKVIKKHFSREYFFLPETIPLPFLSPALGFTKLIYLKEGKYLIEKQNGLIKFKVPITYCNKQYLKPKKIAELDFRKDSNNSVLL